jgi:hypothetical protein
LLGAAAAVEDDLDLLGADRLAREKDGGALDDVPQLADIAGPAMRHHAVHRALAERHAARPLGEEMLDQQRHVLAALAERRQVDREDGEAIEEILAETLGRNGFVDVAVSGGDYAGVDRDLAAAADALHRTLLDHAQQLHLHVGRHVADLVEEKRAAVRIFEAPALLADGAGERAFFMAEQLGFEKVAGNGTAIDRDIGLGCAVAFKMDGASDHFLAAARRAGDDHRSRARRDLADEVAHLDHRAADADEQSFGAVRGCGHERVPFACTLSKNPRIIAPYHFCGLTLF